MPRTFRALCIGLSLALTAPAFAQMSFEGLDLSGNKKKKKKKPTNTKPSGHDKDDDAPLPAGGLDLTKPADKADKDDAKPKKSAPTMTFEAVDVSGKSADKQRLDAALNEFKDEQYERAVMSSHELMQDPKLAGLHLDSQYLLAKSLYRMGMYHSALGQFSKLLSKGPQTKFFKPSLEWLFFISHKTTNETVILDEIAKYANFEFPEKFRNEFRYLLARYHFVRGRALDDADQKAEADKSYDEVKRLVLLIPRKDAFFPRAKYLEGLAHFREDNFQTALDAMKEVVRLTRPGGNKTAAQAKIDQELRELAFMQLARTHYGHRQNRYAIYYYGKVERGNTQWLEALFESSWANYRIGQYEQALGNLITLSSPFFREEYFPEALILKAVIYYENCRYKEARSILEDFERIYLPVHDQLDALLKKEMDSSEYYNVLADIQRKNKEGTLDAHSADIILERILRLALTDKDLKKTNDSILELEAEMDALGTKSDTFKYSELAKNLLEGLKLQREQLIKKAGMMARGKLDTELGELKKLLANGLRIKFEVTSQEKEFLEAMLRAGGEVATVRKYRYSVAVPDDHLYWPYVGEYWRDELGTYQYTLTKGCIEKQAGRREGDSVSQAN
ncbi:MAG: adventurous gliding motility protein GltC [Myxococcaceae bacterium]